MVSLPSGSCKESQPIWVWRQATNGSFLEIVEQSRSGVPPALDAGLLDGLSTVAWAGEAEPRRVRFDRAGKMNYTSVIVLKLFFN